MTDTYSVDDRMGAAIADGSYWGNDALQAEVRDAAARGADQAADAGKAVVPSSPSSSLQGDALKYKGELEGLMANPRSEYWVGTPGRPAALYQQDYRDLIRAEQQGATVAVGPTHQVDPDHPTSLEGYTLEGIRTAEDRDVYDGFAPVGHQLGFGVDRMQWLISWVTSEPNPTPAAFRAAAVGRGFSDKAIAACLHWHSKEAARRGFD